MSNPEGVNEPTLTCSEVLMPGKDESPVDYSKRKYADALKALSEQGAPTLTCSEVVERLMKECYRGEAVFKGDRVFDDSTFDRAKAEAILHSWRERRVQELEKLLGEAITFIEATAAIGRGIPTLTNLPPYSEWREQIRKGAKHE